MNKFDIEFYNGLMKGVVKCAGIVGKSTSLEEANGKIEGLLGKIQEKIDVMVEESLQEVIFLTQLKFLVDVSKFPKI